MAQHVFVKLYTGCCRRWSSWQLQRYYTVHCTSRCRTLLELTVECGLSIINLSPLTRAISLLYNTTYQILYLTFCTFTNPASYIVLFRSSKWVKIPSPLSRYHTGFIMTQCCQMCILCKEEPFHSNTTSKHLFDYVPVSSIVLVQDQPYTVLTLINYFN